MPNILLENFVSQFMGSLNWASGLIPLGRLHLRPLPGHFNSLGLTNRFTPPCRLDPSVSLRPFSPCHLTPAMGIYRFLRQESLSNLSRRSSRFLPTPLPRAGVTTWCIPRLRVFGPVQKVSSTSMCWSSRR